MWRISGRCGYLRLPANSSTGAAMAWAFAASAIPRSAHLVIGATDGNGAEHNDLCGGSCARGAAGLREESGRSLKAESNVHRCVAVAADPCISLLCDTLPAAEHRTYQLFFGVAYGKRAWPRALVTFDIQVAKGPLNAEAFCTDTFCHPTARLRLFLTVQVITE